MKNRSFYNNLAKEIVNCPICEETEFKKLGKKDRYNMAVQTALCLNCGFIYINPRPTDLALKSFYENDYRRFYENIEIPTKSYIEQGPFIPRANFILETLWSYFQTSKHVLDVGCAEGTVLKKVEDEFLNVKTTGIEPNRGFGNFANKYIKGDVFVGGYENYPQEYPFSKFDIIITAHVLEHILRPKKFLLTMRSLMEENGILYIEVPNILDKRVKGLGAIHLAHVSYFDPSTLKYLLRSCGFEIIKLITNDLPAKTPSMAVICKVSSNHQSQNSPSKNELREKEKFFINNILRINTSNIDYFNLNNFFSKIRSFFN